MDTNTMTAMQVSAYRYLRSLVMPGDVVSIALLSPRGSARAAMLLYVVNPNQITKRLPNGTVDGAGPIVDITIEVADLLNTPRGIRSYGRVEALVVDADGTHKEDEVQAVVADLADHLFGDRDALTVSHMWDTSWQV